MAGRKLLLDQDAFAKITPESAYWSGIMMTDGNISGRYVRYLNISTEDESHVNNLEIFLSLTLKYKG